MIIEGISLQEEMTENLKGKRFSCNFRELKVLRNFLHAISCFEDPDFVPESVSATSQLFPFFNRPR
jgi:hypothetical protein